MNDTGPSGTALNTAGSLHFLVACIVMSQHFVAADPATAAAAVGLAAQPWTANSQACLLPGPDVEARIRAACESLGVPWERFLPEFRKRTALALAWAVPQPRSGCGEFTLDMERWLLPPVTLSQHQLVLSRRLERARALDRPVHLRSSDPMRLLSAAFYLHDRGYRVTGLTLAQRVPD